MIAPGDSRSGSRPPGAVVAASTAEPVGVAEPVVKSTVARAEVSSLVCVRPVCSNARAMNTNSPSQKVLLRREAMRRRAEAHLRLAEAAGKLVQSHGLALLDGNPGRIVSGYLPIRDELTPLPLMLALLKAGRTLALPVIVTKWAPLTFRSWQPADPLVPAAFGLREPLPAAPEVLPDVLLVPLAAFDAEGYRIGYGGGYYDRTLALYRSQRSVTAVGIAHDEQEVPVFAHEPHDQRLDYLITPSGVRTFGP